MASKNDARRMKKKAERARNRRIISKIKVEEARNNKMDTHTFGHYAKSALSDVLSSIGQCESSLYLIDRLLHFTETVDKRSPSYHTEELNDSIKKLKEGGIETHNDLVELRNDLKDVAKKLQGGASVKSELLPTMQFMLGALPKIESSATACGLYTRNLQELIKKSDELYTEAVKTDDTLKPILSDEEREVLGLHAGLSAEYEDAAIEDVIMQSEAEKALGVDKPATCALSSVRVKLADRAMIDDEVFPEGTIVEEFTFNLSTKVDEENVIPCVPFSVVKDGEILNFESVVPCINKLIPDGSETVSVLLKDCADTDVLKYQVFAAMAYRDASMSSSTLVDISGIADEDVRSNIKYSKISSIETTSKYSESDVEDTAKTE